MKFTLRQLANWRAYEKQRLRGTFNMFSREAWASAGLRREEALFCMQHYTALAEAAAAALLADIERKTALGEIE